VKNVPYALTVVAWAQIQKDFGDRCAYCNQPLTEKCITKDCLVPVAKGGGYTPTNAVPACLSCNSSKSDTELTEWRPFIARIAMIDLLAPNAWHAGIEIYPCADVGTESFDQRLQEITSRIDRWIAELPDVPF
jgi:hypothetical protein